MELGTSPNFLLQPFQLLQLREIGKAVVTSKLLKYLPKALDVPLYPPEWKEISVFSGHIVGVAQMHAPRSKQGSMNANAGREL